MEYSNRCTKLSVESMIDQTKSTVIENYEL